MLLKGRLTCTSVILCILSKIQKQSCTHCYSKNAHFYNVLIKASPIRALIPSNHFKVFHYKGKSISHNSQLNLIDDTANNMVFIVATCFEDDTMFTLLMDQYLGDNGLTMISPEWCMVICFILFIVILVVFCMYFKSYVFTLLCVLHILQTIIFHHLWLQCMCNTTSKSRWPNTFTVYPTLLFGMGT